MRPSSSSLVMARARISFSVKSLNRLSMGSFVRMEISARESHNCGAEVTRTEARGEDRVKTDLPGAVLSYYDKYGTHYFCRVLFPYRFCAHEPLTSSLYKSEMRRDGHSWRHRPS